MQSARTRRGRASRACRGLSHVGRCEGVGSDMGMERRGNARVAKVLERMTKPLADGLTLAEHLIAGAAATGFAVGVMHPMDTVKTCMQKAAPAHHGGQLNMIGAVKKILAESGVAGLFFGVGPNVSAQMPAGAIKFAAFETLTQFFRPRFAESARNVVEFSCAALAFVVCSVVVVPGEVMKQRLQAGVYSSLREGIAEIWAQEGVRGFFAGYNALLLRDVPYTMLEFGLYAEFKALGRKLLKRDQLTAQQELMLGGAAGGVTGFLTTPLDVAKTKLMTQAHVDPALRYKSISDALIRVAKEDGVSGLFRGATARVLWLVPFTAVFFGVHEFSKRQFKQRRATKISRTAAVIPRGSFSKAGASR
ncbi:putative S-adenosylmethionine carrier 2, chloroplastic [Porphyridium purpureum]|uniref:Putative S-adenosylmethionine carrier 2, chloroplastic n=1 Tax=Porphyridium purpureum TaxID=35688 RepID=A0A5J4YWR7_PORPP|nr:putative S-adenosylmethionine carrier 2, chloroplastic [Porphyridium purpureum]|eukprot:POR2460..scf209_3